MSPFIPLPSGDQLVPSQLATCAADAPLAAVKDPPAISSAPLPSSKAVTHTTLSFSQRFPQPSSDQPTPSHLATLFAKALPALRKLPAACSAGPLPSSNTARAWSVSPSWKPPTPVQAEPDQR